MYSKSLSSLLVRKCPLRYSLGWIFLPHTAHSTDFSSVGAIMSSQSCPICKLSVSHTMRQYMVSHRCMYPSAYHFVYHDCTYRLRIVFCNTAPCNGLLADVVCFTCTISNQFYLVYSLSFPKKKIDRKDRYIYPSALKAMGIFPSVIDQLCNRFEILHRAPQWSDKISKRLYNWNVNGCYGRTRFREICVKDGLRTDIPYCTKPW